jgi:hypothetical protein
MPAKVRESGMTKRRRVKQTMTLADRLAAEARRLRAKAGSLPPGPDRDDTLQRAQEIETTAQLSGWLTSPGLQLPD